MPNIVKGDSYAIRRPMWTHEFVDINNDPMDFAGCTLLTTYKPSIVPIDDDPDDSEAVVRHSIVFDMDGQPTSENGLFYIAPGVIVERFPSELTRTLPTGVALRFDIQLEDANGEYFTFVIGETVTATDSITNRFQPAT